MLLAVFANEVREKQWGMFKGEKLNVTATNEGPKHVKVFLLVKLFFKLTGHELICFELISFDFLSWWGGREKYMLQTNHVTVVMV